MTSRDDSNEPGNPAITKPLDGRHVLIIVENLPVPFDRRVWQEARTLVRHGARVSVICPTGKGYTARHETLEGIEIHRHPLPLEAASPLGYLREYGAALWWETRLAWRIWRNGGIDVIHACNPPDLIFLVALPFKLLGKKFIFDHHDINPELYEAKFERRDFYWRLMVLFEWLTFKSADVVICTNESYRAIAQRRGGKKREDTFVVRSGPDLTRVKRMPVDNRWRNGRRFLVGYVGVMGEQEGIDLLLESVRHIVHDKARTDIQFCLVGGGSHYDALVQLAERLGVTDHVTFTGRLPDAELFSVLSSADLCVNPDRVNPMNDLSTMNKIIEYMAFEKPIVQFDVKEGRYSAQDASVYAARNDPLDFADKMLTLLDDPARRAAMGASGLQRVERELCWEKQIEPLLAAYRRALG